VKLSASTTLDAFEEVRSELFGKAVVLTDETTENISLDELHGLRISIRGRAGKLPILLSSLGGARPPSGGFFVDRPAFGTQSVIYFGGLQGPEDDPNSIAIGHGRSVRVL
jgi:hypothetical protein